MTTDTLLTPKDVVNFCERMFAENMSMLRHHETQRSTSTTILCSLAVLMLSIAAVFWEQVPVVPISAGLIIIGVIGGALDMKLFERSAFHLSLALAYQQSAEMLLGETARGAFSHLDGPPDQPRPLPQYVRLALSLNDGFVRCGKNNRSKKNITFVKSGPSDEDNGIRSLSDFNPVAPFAWVDPIHNAHLVILGRRVARWDLYRMWICIFGGFIGLGLIGLMTALVFRSDHSAGTVDRHAIVNYQAGQHSPPRR